MRITANILFALGALVILDGLAAHFLRTSFLALPLFGQGVVPFYVIAVGIGILLVCAVFKTIADIRDARKSKQ